MSKGTDGGIRPGEVLRALTPSAFGSNRLKISGEWDGEGRGGMAWEGGQPGDGEELGGREMQRSWEEGRGRELRARSGEVADLGRAASWLCPRAVMG